MTRDELIDSIKISPQCRAVAANCAVVCPILSGHIAARKRHRCYSVSEVLDTLMHA
jgi:ABC-type sulfate transport system permease component